MQKKNRRRIPLGIRYAMPYIRWIFWGRENCVIRSVLLSRRIAFGWGGNGECLIVQHKSSYGIRGWVCNSVGGRYGFASEMLLMVDWCRPAVADEKHDTSFGHGRSAGTRRIHRLAIHQCPRKTQNCARCYSPNARCKDYDDSGGAAEAVEQNLQDGLSYKHIIYGPISYSVHLDPKYLLFYLISYNLIAINLTFFLNKPSLT